MNKITRTLVVLAGLFISNIVVAAHYHVDFYNYTGVPMHWHVKTSGEDDNADMKAAAAQTIETTALDTGKKTTEEKIAPGHATFKTKFGGDLFKKFEIRALTEGGETLNYPVDPMLAGKHWVVAIEGKPGEKWKITGFYKTPDSQKNAAILATTALSPAGSGLPLSIAMGVAPNSFNLDTKLKKKNTVWSTKTLPKETTK